MKFWDGELDMYVFKCNGCNSVAGQHRDERKALEYARAAAEAQGWRWFHPGWGLECPRCMVRR
jgi:hypothetical protein